MLSELLTTDMTWLFLHPLIAGLVLVSIWCVAGYIWILTALLIIFMRRGVYRGQRVSYFESVGTFAAALGFWVLVLIAFGWRG